MKFFTRSKPSPPPSRHVNQVGRTTAYAYYARRSPESATIGRQLVSDAVNVRNAKRAAQYWRQRFGLLLVIVAVMIGVANVLSLDTEPTIASIGTTNVAFLHSFKTYQSAADELFASSLLNRNKITVDTAAVSAGLKQQFPELSIASITLPLFGRHAVVYVAQAEPALLLSTQNNKTYVIDAKGRAIAPGSTARPSLQLIPVRDASGATVRLGQLAVPGGTVEFIKTIHFQLAQRQTHVSTFVLPAGSSELDFYPAGQKYFVKCNLASDSVLQQAGTFLALQQYLEEKGIVPGQYVDVRVDGRAYYR